MREDTSRGEGINKEAGINNGITETVGIRGSKGITETVVDISSKEIVVDISNREIKGTTETEGISNKGITGRVDISSNKESPEISKESISRVDISRIGTSKAITSSSSNQLTTTCTSGDNQCSNQQRNRCLNPWSKLS